MHYAERFQEESNRAILGMMVFNLPRPTRVTTPLLVLGAECDGCITSKEVRRNGTCVSHRSRNLAPLTLPWVD